MTIGNEIATRPDEPELTPYEVIERVITSGDLSRMDAQGRVAFYWRTCESLGLNPLTQPFRYLQLDGKLTLYATKDATEQLRRVNRVSVTGLERSVDDNLGILTVVAHGRTPDGREDASSGIVSIRGLSGQALANTMMKAETKAKRRLTLALVGLGFLDESEVDATGGSVVDPDTDVVERPAPASLLDQVRRQTEAYTTPVEPATPEPSELISATTPPILTEPMTEAASSAIVERDDEPEDVDVEDLTEGLEDEAELLAQLHAVPDPGMTLQELADRAREAGIGKLKFAVALECVPADVGARIEAMTDQQRYALWTQLSSQP